MINDFKHIWDKLDTTCSKYDYAGWDPFDALNSRIFQATPLAYSKWTRLAWLQFFKRSPINFRKLSLVPRTHNAKALALFVRSYIEAGEIEKAKHCLDKMMSLRSNSKEWGNAAWGYPFDWQAKAFFVPKDMPNVICTSYAVLALEAANNSDITSDADSLIIASADFVIDKLLRNNEEHGDYIAYIPSSDAFVHNASLWGAYICAKAYSISKDNDYKNVVEKVITSTLKAQGKDGHWPYGTLPHHQFIDGFHTGYNLEALYRINQIMANDDIAKSIEIGLQYYVDNFFNDDGRASYYHNNPYPLDPHSVAQAIITINLIDKEKYSDLRDKIASYCCNNLWNEKHGYFYYQKQKSITNKICYLRWTQAWMHLALSTLK